LIDGCNTLVPGLPRISKGLKLCREQLKLLKSEMEPDFDMFIRRNPQHYPYRHRVSPSLDSPLFSAKEIAGKGAEHVTNQHMLLLFTICFIAAYHFRGELYLILLSKEYPYQRLTKLNQL
jgi:hypothetical protein